MEGLVKRLGALVTTFGGKSEDPRTEAEPNLPTNVFNIEALPMEIIGVIASKLPFRRFMALLNVNKKFRKLLAENELWSCQIEKLTASSKYRGQPNCRVLFKKIYVNRKTLEPAKFDRFKSAYISTVISNKSNDKPMYNSLASHIGNIRLDDTLFVYQTRQSNNVNVVLSTYNSKPYFVRSIKISNGTGQYVDTPVLSAGLIFLFNEEPDLTTISKYDSFTKGQWDELSAQYGSLQALQAAGCPVKYFEGLEKEPERMLFINFKAPCLVATHFVLKMLRSCDETRAGMNVANFILYGGLADATYTETQWLDNAEPDDIDMGGLSDFDDFGDFE